jgi:cell division protein ZapA
VPKVDISINGRLYAVACDDGQEARVRDLASMMDSRVRQLAGPSPVGVAGETHLLVLAGLMLADELSESQAAQPQPAPSDQNIADEELLIAAVDHLTDRITVIADRLGRA